VRRGRGGAVVVARLDRLARSLSDAARLLERAKRKGWNLVALDLGLDLSTPEGEQVAKIRSPGLQGGRVTSVNAFSNESTNFSLSQAVRGHVEADVVLTFCNA